MLLLWYSLHNFVLSTSDQCQGSKIQWSSPQFAQEYGVLTYHFNQQKRDKMLSSTQETLTWSKLTIVFPLCLIVVSFRCHLVTVFLHHLVSLSLCFIVASFHHFLFSSLTRFTVVYCFLVPSSVFISLHRLVSFLSGWRSCFVSSASRVFCCVVSFSSKSRFIIFQPIAFNR